MIGAGIPGSLYTQSLDPLDGKYLVANFSDLVTGLISKGLLRFVDSQNKLYIKTVSGWKNVLTEDSLSSAFSILINSAISGSTASVTNSGTAQNVKLDFVIPKGDKGDAATIDIYQITTSSDGNFHIYNDGDQYNASYRLEIPAGPEGPAGIFIINDSGTFSGRDKYDYTDKGFTYLVDDPFGPNDGLLYIKSISGIDDWDGPYPFKGPVGASIYIAYADTYDGINASYTPNSNKRYVSFQQAFDQPNISTFTTWIPVTLNPTGYITEGELDSRLSELYLDDLVRVTEAGIQDGYVLTWDSAMDTWRPEPLPPSSGGDMLKSIYDTNNNGIVDNSEKLGGKVETALTVLSSTKLATARTINGTSFDGTANITVVDNTKEPAITAGTTSQYYRGDKTFQTLNQDAVPDGTTNKAYTNTEKTKLSGISNNANAFLGIYTTGLVVKVDDTVLFNNQLYYSTTAHTTSGTFNSSSYWLPAGGQVDVHSTLTYASSITPDFNTDNMRTITLTGNLTIPGTTNKAAAKSKLIRIIGDTVSRTLSFPSAWIPQNMMLPTSIAPNKIGILSLTCFGTSESDVLAAYSVQP